MSRLSIAALAFAFIAFAIGVVAPVVDPGALRAQLSFAQRAGDDPERDASEPGLRAEAARWLARKIRERNDRAEAEKAKALEEAGPLGAAVAYVFPVQVLLALAAFAMALADWLRTRALRANLTAGLVAAAAIALPFAWSALAIAVTVVAVIIALAIVGRVLG